MANFHLLGVGNPSTNEVCPRGGTQGPQGQTTLKQKKNRHSDWRLAWDRVNEFRAGLDLAPYDYTFANDPDIARLFCNVLNHLQHKEQRQGGECHPP